MATEDPKLGIYRTFRVYFDIEVLDTNPDVADHEDVIIGEAVDQFYDTADAGEPPQVVELL